VRHTSFGRIASLYNNSQIIRVYAQSVPSIHRRNLLDATPLANNGVKG